MFSNQGRSFVSLPGGAVVDPGPGCVGWSPEVVFVVPLPDMRIKYMNILRLMVFQNQMSFLLRLSVLVVGASGESPLKEGDGKTILKLRFILTF